MEQHSFSVSAIVDAPAAKVYGLVADYQHGHWLIVPKRYFVSMEVEKGGVGAGTVINFKMKLMGSVQSFQSVITEPEPGRVLVESEMKRGAVTTFRVEPREDRNQCLVTISTATPVPDGPMGKLQGWMTQQLLQPVYVKELAQLEAVARGEMATRPSPEGLA